MSPPLKGAITNSSTFHWSWGLDECIRTHVTSRMFITACKAVNYRVILTQ